LHGESASGRWFKSRGVLRAFLRNYADREHTKKTMHFRTGRKCILDVKEIRATYRVAIIVYGLKGKPNTTAKSASTDFRSLPEFHRGKRRKVAVVERDLVRGLSMQKDLGGGPVFRKNYSGFQGSGHWGGGGFPVLVSTLGTKGFTLIL